MSESPERGAGGPQRRVDEARRVLSSLGMPPAQQNAMGALTLLALLDLRPDMPWAEASKPLRGVSPIIDFANAHYGTRYRENTRETFRKDTIHHFEEARLIVKNPDQPDRPTNSPRTVYQITDPVLDLVRTYGTPAWEAQLSAYLATVEPLVDRYAQRRQMTQVPLKLLTGQSVSLSPGAHSDLIELVISEFAPRFTPDGVLIYAGDTGNKWGSYFDRESLERVGVVIPSRGAKMPDVVIHDPAEHRGWLVLIDAFTSRGPIDPLRREQLRRLFAGFGPALVFVTAFPNRRTMARQAGRLAWGTEVWCADHPEHLVHYDGKRFLGPYEP